MSGIPVFTSPWIPSSGYKPAQWLPNSSQAQMILTNSPNAVSYSTVYAVGDADVGALRTSLYAYEPIGAANVQLQSTVGGALKVSFAATVATGASINGTAAASGIIKPANANSSQVIIQNVDAAETLYVSFNNPATVDDVSLQPGMSITYNSGIANDIYGLGSGAGAKYSIQELSS